MNDDVPEEILKEYRQVLHQAVDKIVARPGGSPMAVDDLKIDLLDEAFKRETTKHPDRKHDRKFVFKFATRWTEKIVEEQRRRILKEREEIMDVLQVKYNERLRPAQERLERRTDEARERFNEYVAQIRQEFDEARDPELAALDVL